MGVLLSTSSCSTESPFDQSGEGSLQLKMVVNSEVKRAKMATSEESLAEKCIIYISGSSGLLHKFIGLDNAPSSIALRTGHYVAEAWTGDSVSASFDSKFYKAYEPFEIERGGVTNVVLNCKIANVVASINPDEALEGKLKNYTVTISNTRGQLDFNEENASYAHGYYMMPNGDTSLKWSIQGENEDGKAFTKTGVIENVKSAHEYVLNLSYNPSVSGDTTGGGFITVTVNDEELLIEDNITIHAAPVFAGEGFDITSGLTGPKGSFDDTTVKVYAADAFSKLEISTTAYDKLGLPTDKFDLCNLSETAETALKNAGLSWTFKYKSEQNQTNAIITFDDAMLNNLENGDYEISFTAADSGKRERTQTLKISVSDAAVVVSEADASEIRAYSATLHGTTVKDEYTNPGIQYRASGSQTWQFEAANTSTRSADWSVTLSGLQAGTKYEYRAAADGYTNTTVYTFTTETPFEIPNAGFESWVTNSKGAYIPGSSTDPTFWDTGNHGSITMSKNITTPTSDILHAGSYSIKMESQFVGIGTIGKFAAGNVFAGQYLRTDGTDGVLSFGREFNGSHPIKLRGWAHYRPGTVEYAGGNITKGETDQGQVYVALTTKTYEIRTKTSERQLFDSNDSGVLAYGDIVWTGNYGADGSMQQFEITLTPRDGYYTSKPAYLVLVASASRYGDYFAGGKSILYLDDLEFVYE